jgi:hypothetical protein
MAETYYDLLELSPKARPETIVAAFRAIVQGTTDPDLLRRISEAYAVLSNPAQRAEYDKRCADDGGKAAGPPAGGGGMIDLCRTWDSPLEEKAAAIAKAEKGGAGKGGAGKGGAGKETIRKGEEDPVPAITAKEGQPMTLAEAKHIIDQPATSPLVSFRPVTEVPESGDDFLGEATPFPAKKTAGTLAVASPDLTTTAPGAHAWPKSPSVMDGDELGFDLPDEVAAISATKTVGLLTAARPTQAAQATQAPGANARPRSPSAADGAELGFDLPDEAAAISATKTVGLLTAARPAQVSQAPGANARPRPPSATDGAELGFDLPDEAAAISAKKTVGLLNAARPTQATQAPGANAWPRSHPEAEATESLIDLPGEKAPTPAKGAADTPAVADGSRAAARAQVPVPEEAWLPLPGEGPGGVPPPAHPPQREESLSGTRPAREGRAPPAIEEIPGMVDLGAAWTPQPDEKGERPQAERPIAAARQTEKTPGGPPAEARGTPNAEQIPATVKVPASVPEPPIADILDLSASWTKPVETAPIATATATATAVALAQTPPAPAGAPGVASGAPVGVAGGGAPGGAAAPSAGAPAGRRRMTYVQARNTLIELKRVDPEGYKKVLAKYIARGTPLPPEVLPDPNDVLM